MNRIAALLALSTLAIVSMNLGSTSAATIVIKGVDTPGQMHVWRYDAVDSKPSKVGDPDITKRLVIKVKNGDTVQFVVESGSHGVIFEKAKSQLKAGIFEVVPATGGELVLKDPSTDSMNPLFLQPYYDLTDAQLSLKRTSPGSIITIKIKALPAGTDKGILFGCNPHSKPPANSNVAMLGILVLDEDLQGKDKDGKAGK